LSGKKAKSDSGKSNKKRVDKANNKKKEPEPVNGMKKKGTSSPLPTRSLRNKK
jgi:hypothetical protein